jgi:hypothetical protein
VRFLTESKENMTKISHVVKPHGKSSFFIQNMASRKTRIMWPSSFCKPFYFHLTITTLLAL